MPQNVNECDRGSSTQGYADFQRYHTILAICSMNEQLPSEVIGQILWSDHLGLLDKLRCQEVCKSWRHLLQSVTGDHGRLAEELLITIANTESLYFPVTRRRRTALRLKAGKPYIHVAYTTEADPSPAYAACWQWLSLNAKAFSKIVLTGVHPQSWQLQAFLKLFKTHMHPAAQVVLKAGIPSVYLRAGSIMTLLALLRLSLQLAAVLFCSDHRMMQQFCSCLLQMLHC